MEAHLQHQRASLQMEAMTGWASTARVSCCRQNFRVENFKRRELLQYRGQGGQFRKEAAPGQGRNAGNLTSIHHFLFNHDNQKQNSKAWLSLSRYPDRSDQQQQGPWASNVLKNRLIVCYCVLSLHCEDSIKCRQDSG